MEPVRIRENVDPNSPEYKRSLRWVILILVVLMLGGGSCLGYRIRQMEEYNAARQDAESAPGYQAQPEGASGDHAPGRYRWKSTDEKAGSNTSK